MPELTLTRQTDLSHLAGGAVAGDAHAWTDLVRRLDGVPHTVARRYRLTEADVGDIAQTTWLRALARVDRINDPPGRSRRG